jgi:hypothetical protein
MKDDYRHNTALTAYAAALKYLERAGNDLRKKMEEAARIRAAAAAANGLDDEFRDLNDEVARVRHEAEEAEREREAVRKAELLEPLIRRLEKLGERLQKVAGYTPQNCPNKHVFAEAMRRKEKIEKDIDALKDEISKLAFGPSEVAFPLDLSGVLAVIIAELGRFFVLSERDAQIIALRVVHTHIFLYKHRAAAGVGEARVGKFNARDHQDRDARHSLDRHLPRRRRLPARATRKRCPCMCGSTPRLRMAGASSR